MKKCTLQDIAQRAGVSKTIVSYVVNDKPDGYGNVTVRPELRARIKAMAEEMHYRPHRSARSLSTGNSNLIGILSAHSEYTFSLEKTYEVCEGIMARNYDYILQEIDYAHYERLEKALDLFFDYNVSGMVLVSLSPSFVRPDDMKKLENSGLPVVDASGAPNGRFPCVRTDYYDAFFRMATAVIEKGCREIYVVTAETYKRYPNLYARVEGVTAACAGAAQCTVFAGSREKKISDVEAGYQITADMLSSARPDAILYSNDYHAFGGLKAIHEKGLRVPDDLLVCGFDGSEISRFTVPPITTAVQPVGRIAHKSVDLLFDILAGKAELNQADYKIPCEIIYRESTGDPGKSDFAS